MRETWTCTHYIHVCDGSVFFYHLNTLYHIFGDIYVHGNLWEHAWNLLILKLLWTIYTKMDKL